MFGLTFGAFRSGAREQNGFGTGHTVRWRLLGMSNLFCKWPVMSLSNRIISVLNGVSGLSHVLLSFVSRSRRLAAPYQSQQRRSPTHAPHPAAQLNSSWSRSNRMFSADFNFSLFYAVMTLPVHGLACARDNTRANNNLYPD